MDNQTLRDRFRYQLTNVHALTVLTVSLFEIIGYIILIVNKIESFSLRNHYLWYGVVFPIIVNAVTHLIARAIINNPNVDRKRKNTSIIVAALVTSFVVAIIHKEYIVTSCAFIFPIILCSLFNERKLLNVSFVTSIFILLAEGLAFWLDNNITLTTSINLFVLFGFSFISFLCGIISINFSKQSYTTIESQATQNNQLLQDIQKDQMTTLYNHNTFVKNLDKHITSFCEEKPLFIAMLDIDNFKHINDTYGHDSGDVVLKFLAKTMQKHCTLNDTVYRYGGEEFAIIFFEKTTDEVVTILENILHEFRNHTFDFTDKSITFSAGIAKYSADLTRNCFFEKADKTLYKAKNEGKNRVLTAEQTLSSV